MDGGRRAVNPALICEIANGPIEAWATLVYIPLWPNHRSQVNLLPVKSE